MGGWKMPDQRLLFLARDARERAEEILAKAETFNDGSAKQTMRELAVRYEKLADRLKRRAGGEL
jgi:plasmid stabilization system protein ParE